MTRRPTRRPAAAAIWVLAVLAAVGAIGLAAARQFVAARQATEARENRAQATWLARAGVELGAARLAAEPDAYTGEEAEPVPAGKVRITVRPDPAGKDSYRLESEARYPADRRGTVVRTESRTVRLTGGRFEVSAAK